MARRSQSSSQGDNPLHPDYLPPHYKEYYRLALDALAEGGAEAYRRFLAEEGVPGFLSNSEMEHITRHLKQPQYANREPSPPDAARPPPVDVDMDGSSGTYWPMNSDLAVPELDLGWPMTYGFQGTEVTTLVQPPPPDNPSIKEQARRMIRSAQQVVAIVMDVFTDVDLLSEVLDAASRRVPVYILLDEMNAQEFLDTAEKCRVNLNYVDFLRVRTVAGPTYYCRTGKSFKGHVKEKFLLVDCMMVLSGSYSFMWSFEKIHRSIAHIFQGELVSSFDEEFRILFAQSEPLVPAAGVLLRSDTAYALAPYGGAGPLMGPLMGPLGGTGGFYPKRPHLLFPPREEGLGFPPFMDRVDHDRHFLSPFHRDELGRPMGEGQGLRLFSRKQTELEAGHAGDPGRAFLRAKQLELDAFKRHSFAEGTVENFASTKQFSRQLFLNHGAGADDFRFQTSHFQKDHFYQYQFEPPAGPSRPHGLFEKIRAGRPGFGDPEDFGDGLRPAALEAGFGRDGSPPLQRLEFVPSSSSREVRRGSDRASGQGAGPLAAGPPRRPNLGQKFLCQKSPTPRPGPEQQLFFQEPEPEPEPDRRSLENRAGLRSWRINSYLSGCQSDSGGEGLPEPMESEGYDDVLGGPPGELLPSLRAPGPFGPKPPGAEGPEGNLAKQDSFRSRPNPVVQRSSRLRSSLIFSSSNLEGPGAGAGGAEKVQLVQKEQTVSETVGDGEAVRTATSSKVAELLEKYKSTSRGAGGGAAVVHGQATSRLRLEERTQADGQKKSVEATECQSLESRLLELRDSFAYKLHEEVERAQAQGQAQAQGTATLTATQLLDSFSKDSPASAARGGGDAGAASHFLSGDHRPRPPLPLPPPERRGSPTFSGEPPGRPRPCSPGLEGGARMPSPEGRGSPRPEEGSPVQSPREFLRRGSLRLKQLLTPKSERQAEPEPGSQGPQENGRPEGPGARKPSRGDSLEGGDEDRAPGKAHLAAQARPANALYSSNLRDDTKVILEQISAHGQKNRPELARLAPASASASSPELSALTPGGLDAGRAQGMSDKDKCSAIFRSDSFGAPSRFSRTLPASLEDRDTLLRKMESMRKEKRVYSRFEVFCKKEEQAGPGDGEDEADVKDKKVGKFMPKILGTFKAKK
ncbi:protein FAM83H [Ornithorhynchus anatinus]|nr:protein FAM83H [Ornithorhynchus anatinus]XP_028919296.1 protein FAM83H [Ornithorhynchus anatinus]